MDESEWLGCPDLADIFAKAASNIGVGAVKETDGRVIDNENSEAKSNAPKAKGHVQDATGQAEGKLGDKA